MLNKKKKKNKMRSTEFVPTMPLPTKGYIHKLDCIIIEEFTRFDFCSDNLDVWLEDCLTHLNNALANSSHKDELLLDTRWRNTDSYNKRARFIYREFKKWIKRFYGNNAWKNIKEEIKDRDTFLHNIKSKYRKDGKLFTKATPIDHNAMIMNYLED